MHDPHVLLFEVPGFPTRRRGVWTSSTLLSVWHAEPGGNDAGKICEWDRMKWHFWHWMVRITFWQRLRRRWLTKCAWCDGDSTDESPVNTSGWDHIDSPWYTGELGLYHHECMMARNAHETCTCIMPTTGMGGNVCVNCGLVVRLVDAEQIRFIRRMKDTPYGARPLLADDER
jgi:hypothetical protein